MFAVEFKTVFNEFPTQQFPKGPKSYGAFNKESVMGQFEKAEHDLANPTLVL